MTSSQCIAVLLRGKWKLDLLYRLSEGCIRWSILVHSIPEAAPNVLTRQLRQLERDGLARRIITSSQPPQIIEYTLSDAGRRLVSLLLALVRWDKRFNDAPSEKPDFSISQRVISSPWMIRILTSVTTSRRFGSIQTDLVGISRGVLAAQLQELRDMGLVSQKRFDCFPPHVEYALSDKGRALLDILLPAVADPTAQHV